MCSKVLLGCWSVEESQVPFGEEGQSQECSGKREVSSSQSSGAQDWGRWGEVGVVDGRELGSRKDGEEEREDSEGGDVSV